MVYVRTEREKLMLLKQLKTAEKIAVLVPLVVVALYIMCDGKMLILRRLKHKAQGDKWGLPAGKLERGERIVQALAREVRQETGLYFQPDRFTFIDTWLVRHENPLLEFKYHSYAIHLNCAPYPTVRLSKDEHDAYRWVTPREALLPPWGDFLVDDFAPLIMLHRARLENSG
jgi:8-oxo-dGTP pyrophosphatase MutT (NUDIX family)